ncbi:MAG: threonine--tRNA ligase [Deltaproteobacteria bacterium]|nr:threonine--tRNA ligase [Deltaproteobacteria bacterium]
MFFPILIAFTSFSILRRSCFGSAGGIWNFLKLFSREGLEEREISSDLDRLRHSTAHIMAHAVKRLYPQAKFGIGPTIEDGFYYDIDLDVQLTPEDLPRIEAEMKKIAGENQPFIREELPVEDARALFAKLDQPFKLEIIRDFGNASYSIYKEGDFIDLCRGPHVSHAGKSKHFKLLSIAGAYWRGNQKNKQLQRVYGTAFLKKQDLDDYLFMIEEAKKRDHRKLGKELDLFSFDPVAPGSPFFHPKGTIVYNRLVQYMRDLYKIYDYEEIITPQVLDVSLWHKSGHYENYRENMYFTEVEEREFAVKPMNCPASTFVYSSRRRSYRELPLRLADFGRLHRFEKSGALSGLTRVRTFCQDDAHIFCAPEQIEAEVIALIDMITRSYDLFGFREVKTYLSTRPPKRAGDDALWDKAEAALELALKNKGRPYSISKGDGVFYGPKIDFIVKDALKREWQLGTIQLDFNMPERFELEYIGADNSAHRPVMVHRAILGSIERFMGVLVEHYAGAFPFWLAPVQCVLAPIAAEHARYCHEFARELRAAGVRAEVDDRNESISLKTRETQMRKIPMMLVAGGREVEGGTFALRKYSEKASTVFKQGELRDMMVSLNSVGAPAGRDMGAPAGRDAGNPS